MSHGQECNLQLATPNIGWYCDQAFTIRSQCVNLACTEVGI